MVTTVLWVGEETETQEVEAIGFREQRTKAEEPE